MINYLKKIRNPGLIILLTLALSGETVYPRPEEKTAEIKVINWFISEEAGLNRANSENKPVIIDFFAEWCEPCKDLDRFTYSDNKVINELTEFVAIKIDTTNINPEINKLLQKYEIMGLPVILFIDKKGNVLHDFTITGFKNPDEFIRIIQEIKVKYQ